MEWLDLRRRVAGDQRESVGGKFKRGPETPTLPKNREGSGTNGNTSKKAGPSAGGKCDGNLKFEI